MKIYNQEKTKIIQNPDLTIGYLRPDTIVVETIPAKKEVQERYHYIYKDYKDSSGKIYGRDQIKVIDTPYKPSTEEQIIEEEILVYILYTEDELKTIHMSELKYRLTKITEDIIQYSAGEQVQDIEKRKAEFVELHNELRILEGKAPRTLRST